MSSSEDRPSLLYVRRFHRGRTWDHWLYHRFRDLVRYYRPGGHYWQFKGQTGYFRAALHTVFNVTTVPLKKYLNMADRERETYRGVVIDLKAFHFDEERANRTVETVRGHSHLPHALLASNDVAGEIPPDRILNPFSAVFKREPLRDRGRYDISNDNREKIVPTMLGCPLIHVTRWNVDRVDPASEGPRNYPETFDHDVFFAGINTSRLRERIVKVLVDRVEGFYGGLQFRVSEPEIDRSYGFRRLSTSEFRRTMRRSRINLTMDGMGEFTYRHNEAWFLSTFLLCADSIRKIDLPMEMEEGTHYVCFEDEEDLLKKIDHYLARPKERRRIAEAGREAFEKQFDYRRHGEEIREAFPG